MPPAPKSASEALSRAQTPRTAAQALSEYWGDVDRRAKELGEDLLLPFYDSIERKTRRENTGHEGPVDQQDREWDEKMRKFRRRKGK